MHKSDKSPFTPPTPPAPSEVTQPSSSASACPMKPGNKDVKDAPAAESPSYISKLNPLNYMPTNLSNKRESQHQSVSLPLEREASTIPRGDGTGNWEYPSPQQMYNAMLRKGYTDTPAEHVEAMVAVHNFLNEGAWEEIKEWERRFSGGLAQGWQECRRGEEGAALAAQLQALRNEGHEPRLARFEGRPSDTTPKARMLAFMAKVYPSQFPDNPPFDRHDWFVERRAPGEEKAREVRYVIDYYSGPPEPTGEPVFYLDVRPAIDGPTAAAERLMRWGGDVWWRASGGSVREELERMRREKMRS